MGETALKARPKTQNDLLVQDSFKFHPLAMGHLYLGMFGTTDREGWGGAN